MSNYLMIDEAAKLAGISFRELIQKGISGELSVYALGDWIWFSRLLILSPLQTALIR